MIANSDLYSSAHLNKETFLVGPLKKKMRGKKLLLSSDSEAASKWYDLWCFSVDVCRRIIQLSVKNKGQKASNTTWWDEAVTFASFPRKKKNSVHEDNSILKGNEKKERRDK